MKGQKREEKKGVVWPRPTGLVVSAIMQLLEVFWFRRDVRRRGWRGEGGASLTVTHHCAVGQDGGGETEKGRPRGEGRYTGWRSGGRIFPAS